MKKIYVIPDIELVEFEINDIITNSIATGGDESGRNDVSHDEFGDIWFGGNGGTFRMGGTTFTFGKGN